MEVAKAMRTALMAGTLLMGSEPLNSFGEDRQAQVAAWPGHLAVWHALR